MNFTRSFIVIVSVKNLERVLNNVGKKPKIERGSENEGFERRHVSDICLLQVSTTQTESAFYRKEYRVN